MRFTIRDVLLATFVIALSIGWAVDRTRCVQARRDETNFWKYLAIDLQNELEAQGCVVSVGAERTIVITHPDGTMTGRTGLTGRAATGLDPSAKWPTADELEFMGQ